tara:strand:+ start:2161 stop:3636 length:1476 start_codon:yes stop_codon:yes gene_type:complete
MPKMINTNTNRLSALTCSVLTIFILGLCPTAPAVAQAEPQVAVGEVSLVLGKAYRLTAEGKRTRLQRGDRVSEGDRIDTESSGHVHLRFYDDALVSVRPNSQLTIWRYEFDPLNPADSAIKFDLKEGVTRAISGAAAKAARDRFRLNTPVAAIGVRGTDFVVSADAASTKAVVNEGAIVMAPYSNSCRADALGPCLANALELTDSSLRLASVEQDQPLPQLLPLSAVRSPDKIQEQVQLAISGSATPAASAVTLATSATPSSDQEVSNQVLLEGVTSPAVNAEAKVAAETASVTDFIPVDPISVSAEGNVIEFDFTPPSPLTAKSLSDRQLVWGRYADSPLASDRLALDFEEARASRRITVGTLDYGLFRFEPGPRRLAGDLEITGFQLTSAQAVFNSQTGIVAMSVNGGSLDINFQDNSFATALNLTHELTGEVDFVANGVVVDGGFFRAIEATQRLSGAVSLDGAEAGYQFEKQLAEGVVSGLTLWDSK